MTIPEKYPVEKIVSFDSSPNVLIHSLFEGAQELLGEEKFLQILYCQLSRDNENKNGAQISLSAFSGNEAGRFLQLLETIYGRPGGHGLALRIGRISFKYVLKQMGDAAPLNQPQYRLIPIGRRLEIGLEHLARFVPPGDLAPSVESPAETHWLWRSANVPDCVGRQGSDPCCYAFTGLLQEFMLWAGNGRYYRVVETKCRAIGSLQCEFRIDKKPLD
ncbi:MAG: hypothetical protein IH586_11180 [Anaerolineaceae bacterium]|nr:hypothetical protein [Anaerolineaceae bacterium]